MMSDHFILNDDHTTTPCDMLTWACWLEAAGDRRRVAAWEGDGVKVSTVFLGRDHSFGAGAPLIFETLVFGGPLDGEMDRYGTWDEAQAGHDAMVARVRDES